MTRRLTIVLDESVTEARKTMVSRILEKCTESQPPEDPLATRVVGPCWKWSGSVSGPNGYGRIWNPETRGMTVAHRVMLLAARPFNEGLEVDHLCRNRLCCNPDHLEAVDRSTNVTRGAAAKHLRLMRCAACGSRDGRIVRRRIGRTWMCRPCSKTDVAIKKKNLVAKASRKRRREVPMCAVKERAQSRAFRALGSSISWPMFLTAEEKCLFDVAVLDSQMRKAGR